MGEEANTVATTKRARLRDAVRRKIVEDIIHKVSLDPQTGQRNGKRFALVLDHRSARIVSSCLHAHDLAEEGVVLMENLAKNRQPFLTLEAIYLVEPTPQNLQQMHQDFYLEPEMPKYGAAHVFFIRKPELHLVELFVERFQAETRLPPGKRKRRGKKTIFQFEPLPSRLATLMEVNLDFIANEDHLFHLDMPRALVQLFANEQLESEAEEAIASGLASICATLHEFPLVRYSTDFPLPERVARKLTTRVEQVLQDDATFWFHGDANNQDQQRASLLFLDRRSDLAPLFLHEFTYQALVFDLLKTRDTLVEYTTGAGEKRADLNERDALWLEFRHQHIQVVVERLTARIKELGQSSVARYQNNSSSVSLEEMGRVIKDLPEFKELMAKHAMHMALCQQVMDKVSKQNLIPTSNLEQTIVTGVDAMGDRVSETRILNELAALMRRREVEPKDKLRLACLHAVTLGQVSRENLAKFIHDSDPPLSPESQATLLGLSKLGVNILNTANAGGAAEETGGWFGKRGAETVTAYRTGEALARAKQVANALKVTSGIRPLRFTPHIHDTALALAKDELSWDTFPFVRPPPPGAAGDKDQRDVVRATAIDRALSVRTRFPDGAGGGGGGILAKLRANANAAASSAKYHGARLIIFVCGGITFGEVRALHDVMKSTGREIIIGSTHVIKSQELIDHLRIMGAGEARQFLAEEVDHESEARAFFGFQQQEEGNLAMPQQQQLDDEALLATLVEDEGKLGCVSTVVGCVPFCGKRFANWLDGEDED